MTGVARLALEREARLGRTRRLLQALGRYFEPAAVLVTVPPDAGSYRTVDPPNERESGAAG
jgi:hypothetical protein